MCIVCTDINNFENTFTTLLLNRSVAFYACANGVNDVIEYVRKTTLSLCAMTAIIISLFMKIIKKKK